MASSKYTRGFTYQGILTRIKTPKDLRMSKYEYVLNGVKYFITSKPWMNMYGHWEVFCPDNRDFRTSANYLWIVVANIDRRFAT